LVAGTAVTSARPQDPVQQDPPPPDAQLQDPQQQNAQPPDAQLEAEKEGKEKDVEKHPEARRRRRNVNLDEQWRKAYFDWVLAHPSISQRARGHRLAGIRVSLEEITDSSKTTTVATFVLFDHTTGEARRVEVDASTGEITSDVPLPGHPQSSREEVSDAIEIMRGDVEIARLLDDGAVVDGGFIVDDPEPDRARQATPDQTETPARHRLIQLKVLSRDRFTLLRSVVVDLTDSVIASSGTGP
jgi:hypothetical protein